MRVLRIGYALLAAADDARLAELVARQQAPDARFSRKIAAELSQIAWWNWPPETIWERLPEFQSGDVEAFCARWRT